jgi:hypothetical protein
MHLIAETSVPTGVEAVGNRLLHRFLGIRPHCPLGRTEISLCAGGAELSQFVDFCLGHPTELLRRPTDGPGYDPVFIQHELIVVAEIDRRQLP